MIAFPKTKLITFNNFLINQPLMRKIHVAPCLFSDTAAGNLYDILRVPHDATPSDIKEAYYKLSKIYHPDVKKDDSSLSMFRKITEAYDILGNVKSRQAYDEKNFGKKVIHPFQKQKFSVALYKDLEGRPPFRAPKFDDILARRPMIDQFLKNETEDRRVEVQMDKEDSWHHRQDLSGHWGAERISIVFLFLGIVHGLWEYGEVEYDWGKADPRLSEVVTKYHRQEDIDKARWTW